MEFLKKMYRWLVVPIFYLVPIIDSSHMSELPLVLLMWFTLPTLNPLAIIYFVGFITLVFGFSDRLRVLSLSVGLVAFLIVSAAIVLGNFQVLFLVMSCITAFILAVELKKSWRVKKVREGT